VNDLYDWVAFLVLAGMAAVAARAFLPLSWPPWVRQLVFVAVVVRIFATLARLAVVLYWYGRGDALAYYRHGLNMSEGLRAFDFTLFLASPQLWGTSFVQRVTAIVLTFTGPSVKACFLVFSLLPLVGLVLLGVAVCRALPRANHRLLLQLLLFWPSLAFWPSSIGKEALVILGVGLLAHGVIGREVSIRWIPLGLGFLLLMGIRPHIAVLFAVAIVAVEWMKPNAHWSAVQLLRGVLLLGFAGWILLTGLRQLGLEATDIESIQEFVAYRSGKTAAGGSKIAATSGVSAVPMAFVNVLLRPFPWEAGNPLVAISALETVVFWVFVGRNRSRLWVVLLRWRHSRLLRLALPVTIVLTAFYGGYVSNLGILARQRVVVFPFLFMILAASTVRPTVPLPSPQR
jgi:hypothetical protein